MKNKPYPKTPELDKVKAAKEQSQIIGNFLEHLADKGIELAKYDDNDRLWAINHSTEKILADYFEIDLVKVENERRAILESIRN